MLKLPAIVSDPRGLSLPPRLVHLALGMFDGVHLGHLAVIEAAINSARQCGGIAAVLTFDPHPSHLFNPANPTRLIMPLEAKTDLLLQHGVDLVIVHPFNREFAGISAKDFPTLLTSYMPNLAALYVGENFRYGKGRQGDVTSLIETARPLGLSVFSVQRIRENGEPISSTRIRGELAAGRIERVNALLGHTYRSVGSIQGGRKLGRTLGFPTVNVPWTPELLPRFGVYAVRARKGQGGDSRGGWIPGVANFGVRPTVEEQPDSVPLLEIHFFEPVSWSSGVKIEALWDAFLRPEEKFPSLEALTQALHKDKERAVKFYQKKMVS